MEEVQCATGTLDVLEAATLEHAGEKQDRVWRALNLVAHPIAACRS